MSNMRLKLKVWRQENAKAKGAFQEIDAENISPDMSFLEMMDVVNAKLEGAGKMPIAFDHDCREGICGMCSMVINGRPHGGQKGTTTCQLHMRKFKDGDSITIEPFRADTFSVVRDLVVDRTALDNIIQSGGFVSVNTGGAPDANALPIAKVDADYAFDAAACIGCGACVAACPNASAMLFVGAKITQLSLLPQGQPERETRVLNMITKMDDQGFGACTNHYECADACPKEIPLDVIANMNSEYRRAFFKGPNFESSSEGNG